MIALTNSLIDVLSDGSSIIAMTYHGSTAIVPNYNLAGIAKAALESIVRYLAFDLGERNIRVNAISAGPISTASSRAIKGFKSILEKAAAGAPLRRNVTPEDVGDTPSIWRPTSRERSRPTCTSSTRAFTRWGCGPIR